jgi:hypothetical protein
MYTSLRCNEVLYSMLYSTSTMRQLGKVALNLSKTCIMHSTTLLYFTLLYSTLLYSTLLCTPLLNYTLPCSFLSCFLQLYCTLLYSTFLLKPKNCTCSNTQYIAYAQSTMLACLTHILSVDVASPCVVQYYLSSPYVQQIGLQLLQTEPYGMV